MIAPQVVHRVEPELALPRPRRVRFTTETQKRRFRAGCLALAPLGGVILYGLYATEQDEAFLTRGKVTTARVVSVSAVNNGRSSGRSLTDESAVLFEFHANGTDVIGRCAPEAKRYRDRDLKVGDPIAVTYLPENPRDFVQGRVTSTHLAEKDLDWIIGSTIISLASLGYILLTERYFWQRRTLLKKGVAATATVVTHHTAESGETATYSARYEYRDHMGAKSTGQFDITPKWARKFPDGSKFSVLYLPGAKAPGVPYVLITEAEIIAKG